MAKINIYVPDKLKAAMDKQPEINWSHEFQQIAEAIVKQDWIILITKTGERNDNHL